MKPNQKNEVVEPAKVEPAEPPSTLPSGVFHHDAGSPPMIPPMLVQLMRVMSTGTTARHPQYIYYRWDLRRLVANTLDGPEVIEPGRS
jgi:hypothetical protein